MVRSKQAQLSHILSNHRNLDTPMAWRDKEILTLRDFKPLVITLISIINSEKSSRWALCFNDSYFFSAALLAVLYCGKTPIIPGHLREAVLKEQASEYDALLTDCTLQLNCPIINLATLNISTINHHILPDWPQQQDLILFTSGSTGKPKAIHKSIALLELESQLLLERFQQPLLNQSEANSHCCIVSTVSHQHLYGLTFRILLPLLAGLPFNANITEYHEQLRLYSQPDSQPESTLILIASPAFLKRLDPHIPPISCRLVFSAGGPLDFAEAQTVKQCLQVLPQEIYGTSETGIIATRAQSTANQAWDPFSGITIGQQADGTIDLDSPLFKKGQVIEINDIIQLEAGGFHLSGRKDHIIKIEEKRISLTEIEQRLLQLPEIADAAVITLNQNNRIIIGAVIVLSARGKQNGQLDDQQYGRQHDQPPPINTLPITRQFRQTLRNWLEPVAIPKRWRIVAEIPQNNQGKRTYLELQELFL